MLALTQRGANVWQELYFLYYLNLLGCDILYINSEKDIKDKYPECEEISTLCEGTHKVAAIGSPLGLFNSISDGIISGFRCMEDEISRIQFTAPISCGSSGGSVIDLYGRLIGISTGIYSEGQNLNFAVGSEYIHVFAGNYMNEYEGETNGST